LCSPRAFPSLTDAVEKGICKNLKAALIQDRKRMRNLDSKIHLPGFVCFKYQFHISFAKTFSTASTRSGHISAKYWPSTLRSVCDKADSGILGTRSTITCKQARMTWDHGVLPAALSFL
jgi:hypothetical protein